MVELKGKRLALQRLKKSFTRTVILIAGGGLIIMLGFASCSARVLPNELGVEQVRFGTKTGIEERMYGPGLYFVGPGTTMHSFSHEIHLLEASNDRQESRDKVENNPRFNRQIDEYYDRRDRLLGEGTHRRIEALNVQTSDGYAVVCDVSLLYSITDPVKIAKEFGWGTLYVDGFVINTFRNGVLTTLGKMSAEQFYDEEARIAAVTDAENSLRKAFSDRGFEVNKLLLRNYHYSTSYEKSLQEKKVAVQLTVKNQKESLVNEERAKLQQIESKGNATITIEESKVNAEIAKIQAEADLYSSEVHAKADKELGLAAAEAKRLQSNALTQSGGRYVVGLETAKMFENIQGAVMTPEQYIEFIRNAWSLIGLSSGR